MEFLREEVCGPVASVIRYSRFNDVLNEANGSDYGLTAYLFTNDCEKVMQAMHNFDLVEVFENCIGPEAVNSYYYGRRLSGIGGGDGRHGFEAYLRRRSFYLGVR